MVRMMKIDGSGWAPACALDAVVPSVFVIGSLTQGNDESASGRIADS